MKPEDFQQLREKNPQDLFKEDNGKFYHAATKCKGRFEFKDLALHKNKSFLIVPKAIFQYLVHDVPPEKYLSQNKNIFDYCAGARVKGSWKLQSTCVIDNEIHREDLQKVTRYFISQKGCKIVRVDKTNLQQVQIQAGKWLQTIFDVYEDRPWQDYGLDESYYLESIYKEVAVMKPPQSNQLSLF